MVFRKSSVLTSDGVDSGNDDGLKDGFDDGRDEGSEDGYGAEVKV